MKEAPKLSKRLQAAADLVRDGAFVADVGTDHAYLPIALCILGKARGAVASDINEGPIMRAKEHISEWELEGVIDAVLTDGLCKIEEYSPTDILILGMGGELIADIVERAEFTKNKDIRLILQPMTHSEILRRFLIENGYEIVDECLVLDEKIYQIICAEYSGRKDTSYTDVELLLGRENIKRKDPLLYDVIARFKAVFGERLKGKKSANADVFEEIKMLEALTRLEESR